MDRCKQQALVPPLTTVSATDYQLSSTPTTRSDMSSYIKSAVRWSDRPMLGFIPFVNERDSLGKLITLRTSWSSKTAPVTPRPLQKQRKGKKRERALRLCTKISPRQVVSRVPPVGTYSLPYSWEKKSFKASTSRKAISRFASPAVSCATQPVLFQR